MVTLFLWIPIFFYVYILLAFYTIDVFLTPDIEPTVDKSGCASRRFSQCAIGNLVVLVRCFEYVHHTLKIHGINTVVYEDG